MNEMIAIYSQMRIVLCLVICFLVLLATLTFPRPVELQAAARGIITATYLWWWVSRPRNSLREHGLWQSTLLAITPRVSCSAIVTMNVVVSVVHFVPDLFTSALPHFGKAMLVATMACIGIAAIAHLISIVLCMLRLYCTTYNQRGGLAEVANAIGLAANLGLVGNTLMAAAR